MNISSVSKAIGLGLCVCAAPVAYNNGQHHPKVTHHKPVVHHTRVAAAPTVVDCPTAPNAARVTVTRSSLQDWHMADVPYADNVPVPDKVRTIDEPPSFWMWLVGFASILYGFAKQRIG